MVGGGKIFPTMLCIHVMHLTHPKCMGGGRGSVGKIFATIHVAALVVPFNLRSNFDLLTPRVVGSMGKKLPSMLLHSCFP